MDRGAQGSESVCCRARLQLLQTLGRRWPVGLSSGRLDKKSPGRTQGAVDPRLHREPWQSRLWAGAE